MKKTKYPELEEDIIKSKSMIFRFHGGDLWFRDNVDKFDDLGKCIDEMRESVLKHPGKINKFGWYISYFLPNAEQLKLLKNKKFKDYDIEDDNIHSLTPITYNFFGDTKDNQLCVAEDLLVSEEDFVVEVANKLSNLKTIFFSMDVLFNGFLETSSGTDGQDYLQKHLKNDAWFDGYMIIDTCYRDEEVGGKFLNDLDSLLYIKKNIKPDIKFEFNYLTKKEKEILRSQGLIK
jgi:hypothetical protein